MKRWHSFWSDKRGMGFSEYALAIVIIVVVFGFVYITQFGGNNPLSDGADSSFDRFRQQMDRSAAHNAIPREGSDEEGGVSGGGTLQICGCPPQEPCPGDPIPNPDCPG